MAVFCGQCGTRLNLPMSAVRTSRSPCQFCGGYDGTIRTNYSYPDVLIDNLPGNVNEQADREYADSDVR